MNFHNVLNNTYTLILLFTLALSLVTLCLYYGLMWLRVGLYKNSRIPDASTVSEGDYPSVSVVLVAHNEAEQLKKTLPYLLEQDYPDYEVVVVNYLSTDETPFVLRVCSENYPILKPVVIKNDVNMFQGRKYPVSIGIKSATKDIILLTEADSLPASFNWIKEMIRGYMHGASMVIGNACPNQEKTVLNAFEQYDILTQNASCLGMALAGNPYTATSRNLSFRRDFFFNKGAFIPLYNIPVGGEELFVNHNANKSNTTIVVSDDSSMSFDAPADFAQWHQDRWQRAASSRNFKTRDRLLRVSYPLMQALFLASLVWLLVAGLFPWQILVSVLALKIIWQTLCCYFLAKRFKIKKIQYFSLFFEFYFLVANTFLFFSTLRKKKFQWR